MSLGPLLSASKNSMSSPFKNSQIRIKNHSNTAVRSTWYVIYLFALQAFCNDSTSGENRPEVALLHIILAMITYIVIEI